MLDEFFGFLYCRNEFGGRMASSEDQDGSPFGPSSIPPGDRGAVNIIEGKRVFGKLSPYPFANEAPFFAIDAYRLAHRKHDGTMSREFIYEVVERRDAVGVLLYNRDRRSVIVVKQFRLPTFEKHGNSGWFVETIAGIVKEGETPVEAAIRETFEETGYKIGPPELIAEYFS
jgi:hypothetical protein